MRRLAAIGLVLLASCGGDSTVASVVPADAAFYVSVEADTPRFLDDDPVASLLDSAGLENAEPGPWIGDDAAVFGSSDALGLALAIRDERAAERFARRMRHEFAASRIIDGYLVLTTTRDLLEAAAASEGFDAPEAHGVAVIENATGFAAAESHEVLPRGTRRALEPFLEPDGTTTLRMRREPRAVEFEVSGLRRSTARPPSLADLPSAAWLAIASADAGSTIAGLFTVTAQVDELKRATGLSLDDVLPHLGPGSFFIQGTKYTDMGARLLADTKDERALQRVAVHFARRMAAQDDLYTPRPGADERFVQLRWSRPGSRGELFDDFWIEIRGGRFILETGEATGGVVGGLSDTRRWKDAARRLGGEPTLLIDVSTPERVLRSPTPLAYIAARDAGDGTLRAALVGGRP